LKVCTDYKEKLLLTTLSQCNPVYKEVKGWKADLTGMTTYEELPIELKEYIEYIEQEVGVPIKK
jgi:adenylosuccinate synthase